MAIVIFAEKSYNKDLYLEMVEGESIHFGKFVENDDEDYEFSLTLDDFAVNYHAGSRMPSAFISTVSYRDKTQKIEVNKPLAIGEYRLYQSTYDVIDRFVIDIDTLNIDITEGQPYESDTLRIEIARSRTSEKEVDVIINEAQYTVPLNDAIFLDDYKIHITKKEPIMQSGFQVSSTFGMRTLFVLGLLFMISLAWCFWGNMLKFSGKTEVKRRETIDQLSSTKKRD
jgi:cytochrome c biogenesis protein ResB